jgi:hypothetical protein
MKLSLLKTLLLLVGGFSCAVASAKMNITSAPLSLLVGVVNARLDMEMVDKWTVGPEAAILNWTLNDVNVSAYSLGVNFAHNFNGNFATGAFVTPAANIISATAKIDSTSASVTALFASVVGGYHWFWDSFNLRLGGGLAFGISNATITVEDSTGDDISVPLSGGFLLDFALGFTF